MFTPQKMHALAVGGTPVSKISFVGANAEYSQPANTIAIPAHQVGDLIIISAYNRSAATPSVGSGFTQITSFAGGSGAIRGIIGYRIATTTTTTSGVWNSCNSLSVQIFRGTHATTPIGNSASNWGDNSSTLTYSSFSLANPDGTSWLQASAFWGSTGILPIPTGQTYRTTSTDGSTQRISCFDTNLGASSWPGMSQGISSTYWGSCVVEIKSS